MAFIRHITIDSSDPYELARFWAAVLDGELADDDHPGDPEALVQYPAEGPNVLFVRVPEAKAVKNRVHLDITPVGRGRDDEVERLVGLGAAVIDDRRKPDGWGWVVLADPEGNEFCVELNEEERASLPPRA